MDVEQWIEVSFDSILVRLKVALNRVLKHYLQKNLNGFDSILVRLKG